MKIRKVFRGRFLKAFLISFLLLICLNLLFMYVMYLETQNLNREVIRPNFSTLFMVFKNTQLNYADVLNHMLIIERGYEKIDTKAGEFDFGKRHINWAYHPLSPALGKLLNFIIKSPFWSLWTVNQIFLLVILVGFFYWSRANIPGYEGKLSAWIILLFFIIPPLGYFVNFVTPTAALIGIVFFSLRAWLRSPQEHPTAFLSLIISSFLLGFTRFQGLLVNASLLIFLIIIIVWYKKPIGVKKAIVSFSAIILPLLITMGIFKYYANDPFAWAKIQKSWGVKLVVPWFPIVRYWKSRLVFNLQGDDLFFSYFRVFVLLIFAFLAAKIIISNKNFFRNFYQRHYSDSFINLYFIAVSVGLLILIFFTDLMVGLHRLSTLACLIILIWFEKSRQRISIFVILLLLFVRAVEFTLFFQGVRAFIW